MPIVQVTFQDARSGQPVVVPSKFDLGLFSVGSGQKLQPLNRTTDGSVFRAEVKEKVYVAYFSIDEGYVLSLYPDKPCDVALLTPESADATLEFTIYVWPMQPDSNLPRPEADEDELPAAPGELKYTCTYCNDRYTNPTSPYYGNSTWYNNCRTNPPCT